MTRRGPRYYPDAVAGTVHGVGIPAGRVVLQGDFAVPSSPRGVVLFAHGSGSSRKSPRNRYVAHVLNQIGLATLLFDLLTDNEERADAQTAELRFDIDLLATRLVDATEWVLQQPQVGTDAVGYFGASTGAAAALVAASRIQRHVAAVVSRGGRPDLAGSALASVKAPTLLIVGGNDPAVIRLNMTALQQLHCEKRLEIVPGATHLFEETGALEHVARLAREWFETHPSSRRSRTGRAA